MTLDETTFQNLTGLRDEVGVLSFYVGITPDQAADPQPKAPIEIRNRIRELRQRVRDEGPHDRWKAVDDRLDAISGDLDWLLDAKGHGRGRALFVAVADGRTERIALQMPFRERVILHESPYLRPLVAAVDEGRPAGIVVGHRKGTRLLEWKYGEVEQLASHGFELTDAQLADIKSGPSGTNPQHPGSGHVNRDSFESRIDENLHRFLKNSATETGETAEKRHWDRLVVAGPTKIRQELRDLLSVNNGTQVLVADHTWEEAAPHEIAAQAWPILRSIHEQREERLVAQALDRALSGGAGAVGMRNVLNALNKGRVAHVLFDNELAVEGYSTKDGSLYATVGGPAAQAGFEMHPEPLLIERMVEKVMEMGGSVTPLEGEAAQHLHEHEGVAALLRW